MQRIHGETAQVEVDGPGPSAPFDPYRPLLWPNEANLAGLDSLDWKQLTPWQRALLSLDGTVTTFLEASSLESIDIVRLQQEVQVAQSDHDWLQIPKETDLITRQVLLRGHDSATVYAYAVSVLVPGRLSSEFQQGLQEDGLGRLMERDKIEFRREVLWWGYEHIDGLPMVIKQSTGPDFLSRTYRIISSGQPLMLINEKFPLNGSTPLHG